MAAGSLVVRVSADINDFQRKINAVTKEVNKAADTIAGFGKKMTLGITVPAGLAAFALAKMGAENQQVGRKMARVFGDMTEQANGFIDTIMKVVPETGTELQKMAINLTEVGEDLGFATRQSKEFSEGVLAIAARISTTKMVPFAEAVDAVQKSMMGQTKGLKQLGIVLSETDIKNEAYRMGLIKSGQQLNAHGTALASYSLMLAKTNTMTSEAGAVQQDLATKMAFVKRDFSELADATSNLLLPALSLLVDGLRILVDMLTSIPEGVRTVILLVIALAAAIGPLLVVTTSLVKAFTALRAAVVLLTAAEGIGGLLALLAAPEVLAALAAIAGVLAIAAAAWKKYHKEAAAPAKLPTPPSVKALLGGGTPTSVAVAVDPLQEFQKRSAAVMQAFAQTAEMGRPLTGIFEKVNALNSEALKLYDQQKDKLGEVALAAQDVANRTASIIATQNVANQLYQSKALLKGAASAASRVSDPQQSISNNIASQKIQYETSLRVREAWLRATDTIDATREAMIDFKESIKTAGQDFSAAIAGIKQQYSSFGNAGAAAMGGVKEAAAGLIKEFSLWGLILKIINDILSGIGPQLGAIFGLFKVIGHQLGDVLAPVFKLLYNVIRYVIIAFTWLSRIIVQFTASLLTGVGKLLQGLGNAINKLPGSFGNPLKKSGEALIEYGRSQYKLAGKLKQSQEDLQSASWEKAINGVDALGDAANTAAEELLNLPQSFRYALRAFQSTTPDDVSPTVFAPGSGPNQPSGSGPSAAQAPTQLVLQVSGRTFASIMLNELQFQAKQQLGNSARFAELRLST